ncbi:MAG: CARDB domain-containing protein [Candidatus Thorarchaeota archaeon]
MLTRRITNLFLAGILLTSMVAFPFVAFSSELVDNTRDDDIVQDSARNGFEPAVDLHDYFMIPIEDGYWRDAKTNGVNLNLTGLGVYATVALGFSFPYYDSEFDTVHVSNFGYMSFADSTPSNSYIPGVPYSGVDYDFCLAPFWDFMPALDNIYVWNTSEYCVIQYDHSYYYMGPEAGTFQAVLYVDGTIDFNYLEMVTIEDPTICLNYGDGMYGASFPAAELLGVTNFTVRFEYYIAGAELEVKLDGYQYAEIGTSYLFNATVKNLGTTNETDLQLSFYLNEVLDSYTVIASLDPGENFTYTYEFVGAEEGIQHLRVTIEEVPDEFTYENNEESLQIVVSAERKYAIFQDDWPWPYTDNPESTAIALAGYGIPYDIYPHTSMGNVNLENYTRIIISSSQSVPFYERLYDNMTWFEDFAASGGIIEVHAADQSTEQWVNGTLPGGISYVYESEEFVDIVAPWHQLVNSPYPITDDELDDWNSAIHGHIVNLTFPVQIILENLAGEPVLIEFPLGDGHIIITTQTVEWGYENRNSRMLDNLLLYKPAEIDHEVLVNINAPAFSVPGEEIALDLSVSNWGPDTENNVAVTVHANEELLYSYSIPALSNGSTFQEEIFWTPTFPGAYELTAYVEPVTGEDVVENNMVTKELFVRSEVGAILWDEGHDCHDRDYFASWVEELGRLGYRVDGTSDPINATMLSDYSALVIAEPEVMYWSNETDAIQDFVFNGGGFFAIGDSYQAPLNNLTLFAGIVWEDPGPMELDGATTNITQHAVTEGVSEIYFSSPVSYFNLSGPAVALAYLDEFLLLSVSEVGEGRVAAIAEDNCLDDDNLYESDNLILGNNIIDWLTEGHQYNEISNVQQDPMEVTDTDTVDISCMVTDFAGVDSVTLFYRVDGGMWMSIGMSPTLEETYEVTIPAQVAGALVEYYISAINALNVTTIDDNAGELYQYTVAIPTTTTTTTTATTTSVSTTVTTSVTVTTSTTTTTPTTPPNGTLPDNTIIMVIIIVGAGGAVLVIVIIIVMKKRT